MFFLFFYVFYFHFFFVVDIVGDLTNTESLSRNVFTLLLEKKKTMINKSIKTILLSIGHRVEMEGGMETDKSKFQWEVAKGLSKRN